MIFLWADCGDINDTYSENSLEGCQFCLLNEL